MLTLTAVVVGCIIALTALGRGSLTTPPVSDLAALQVWFDANDPFTAALAIVRVVALSAGWYVLMTIVVGVLARTFGPAQLVAITDRMTLPAVRKMLGRAAGITLTVSTLSMSAVPVMSAVWSGPARSVTEFAAGDEQGNGDLLPWGAAVEGSGMRASRSGGLALPTMERLQSTDSGTSLDGGRSGPGAVMTRETTNDSGQQAPREWLIETGDHLWCVAETILADAWGRAPSDAEITGYWTTLIEVNRVRLVDPDNPDLVLPGQLLVIPDIPPQP